MTVLTNKLIYQMLFLFFIFFVNGSRVYNTFGSYFPRIICSLDKLQRCGGEAFHRHGGFCFEAARYFGNWKLLRLCNVNANDVLK